MMKCIRMGHRIRQAAMKIHAQALAPTDRNISNVPMIAGLGALLSPQSLDLKSHIPDDLIKSICQLPEIQTALHVQSIINLRLHHRNSSGIGENPLKPVHETMSSVQRAAEIFAQFAPGGREHLATLLLQVDILNDSGFPQEASDNTLKEYSMMQKHLLLDPFHLLLAQSKLEWVNGCFDTAIEYAQVASDHSVSVEADDVVYKQTLALNALALSRMVQIDASSKHKQTDLSSVLDMEDILGTFKIASRISSNQYRQNKSSRRSDTELWNTMLATAIAYCNQGVAQLLFIYIKNKKTLVSSPKSSAHVLSIDPAMTVWRQAISYLEDWTTTNTQDKTVFDQDQLVVDLFRAKIYCNMSHALLFSANTTLADHYSTITDTDLKSASEFASLAINIYNTYMTSNLYISMDFATIWKGESESIVSSSKQQQGVNIQSFLQQDLARALTLAASCYAKSGSAVTAQGLFQSSIDLLESPQGRYPWPLTALDARTTFLGYAELCKQWEKRETDYRLNIEKAEKVEDSLPPTWKCKAGILSGVYFHS